MGTSFGVGESEHHDSATAGREAAERARAKLRGANAQIVILFSTSRHDPEVLRDAVRNAFGGGVRVVGGYAVGIITNDLLSYDGFQVGLVAIHSDDVEFELFLESGLAFDEEQVGRRLGEAIRARGPTESLNLMLFYDSVNRTNGRFQLNMATPLLRGIRETAPGLPPFVGAGLVGDMQCRETHQWFDDRVEQQSVVAVGFRGNLQMDTIVMHGCKPSGAYHTITAAEGATVFEIDGRPALELIAELLGDEEGRRRDYSEYSFFVTLGLNKGDEFAFDEEAYVNRLCLRADPRRGGLVLFEPDLVEGSRVQLMRRSLDFSYVRERTRTLLARLEGRKALFAFYIDCAGRAGAYAGTEEEEAEELRRVLGPDVPLLGFFSGVELAPIRGEVTPLDWTGVLTIFSVAADE